ncbi:uncharacterized protein LOC129608330 [Condylostylus longicornis]|uniref:uncharacterized protein LOC129608330 n=1 Tax=Condylostylus longicornis TaxID=2530218 RepID=UPI00244DBF74|nr:uncharacterized protein LOC129608330 [Condylostylus longicornis]
MNCNNKIIPIPIEYWPNLMNMYKIDWPKHLLTFYTIKNYIDWKNNPEIEEEAEEFQFYSLNGDWSDGTHAIIDKSNHVMFNTLNENFKNLSDLLQLLLSIENFYLIITPGEIECDVIKFVNKYNLIIGDGNAAYLYHLNKEIALNFDIRPPSGYKIKTLSEEHANFINNLWKYKHSGSEEYLKKLIQRNLNLGVFDENDCLVAWCLRVEYGLLGTLQVVDTHKRKGLGSLVVKALAKLSAENNFDSAASVDIPNISSKKLFEKVGFEQFGMMRYIYLVPKVE